MSPPVIGKATAVSLIGGRSPPEPLPTTKYLPSGETYYALQPRAEPHLTIFAKPDGTLCNKVMNTDGGDHVFLVKEYVSSPATKLVTDNARKGHVPLTLKIVYLGTSGGIANFRSIWSQDGRILQTDDLMFDPDATHMKYADLAIPVSDMKPDSITIGEMALTNRMAWNTYWPPWASTGK